MQYNSSISKVSELGGIPLSEYDEQGNIKHIYCSLSDLKEPHPYLMESVKKLISNLKQDDFAVQYLKDLPICFCGTRAEDTYFIWGPIAFRHLKQPEKKKYGQMTDNKDGDIKDLYYCSLNRLLSAVALSFYFLNGKEYDIDYFLKYMDEEVTSFPSYDSQIVEYIMNREDTLLLNHTYVEEQVLFDKIRVGDVDGLKQVLKNQHVNYPLLIEDNVLKNEEYMAIASITMAARAAIEGGATSAECFAISDIYLKRISKCRSVRDIKRSVEESHVIFTELVKKYKENKSSNSLIEDCKKYIAQNLFKKISLSDIARALQINASYLSKIFSKSEGKTISEYIQREKIYAAKNMLTYSDRSVYEISEYLHMSTPSYFSCTFKKMTGMTPQEYRSKNHPPEF